MKILLIGSGGREHAMAWKMAQNAEVEKIYCAPGNGGTAKEAKCENIELHKNCELLKFAKENDISLTVVGPEAPLVDGIVDEFKKEGLRIFGPGKYGAGLEGSKSFSKDFMKKYNVKTAEYAVFTDAESSLSYLKKCSYPIVIKADGLAAGKGVVICEDYAASEETIKSFMVDDVFKGSGKKVVIEEYLEGVEASILSITDGKTIVPFVSAKDHKQIFDDNKGPNTGGMGAIAPNPYCTKEVLESFDKDILKPTLKGIQEENMDFIGIIFFGLMITKKGVYLLEYNVRLGDPETQVVLYLMKSDLVDLINAALDKKLSEFKVEFYEGNACCVVAASKGYPASYKTGYEITGIDNVNDKVFCAGVNLENGVYKTAGGRVLCASAKGASLDEAITKAYDDIKKVNFDGIYYRHDIGRAK